jgi:hypothetical protein
MKVALIPPKGYYDYRESDYYLLLAQIEDTTYRREYAGLPMKSYVILDNGAAEGKLVKDELLLQEAAHYGADEIVIPDVMYDGEATLERAREFILSHDTSGLHYMVVTQGKNLEEVLTTTSKILDEFPDATIGIPRHLITTCDNVMARYYVLQHIHERHGQTRKVHLLGTNATFPSEVKYLTAAHSWVRGADTSMPFNYAIAGKELNARTSVERPEGYFDKVHKIDPELLEYNINTFMEWASGTEGTRR